MLFERTGDGAFLPPEAYPRARAGNDRHARSSAARRLVEGDDIGCTSGWDCSTARAARQTRDARDGGVAQLRAALGASGDLRDGDAGHRVDRARRYRYLARTPARIVMLQIEDMLGERTPVNIPGTDHEYPNWRRKLRDDLETIATDGAARSICRSDAGVTPARMKMESTNPRGGGARMKGVVMAGGEGSRLRPLTSRRPKPLAPVANKPVMHHIVDLLRRHGVTEIVATLHYLADEIETYFGDGSEFGVSMAYVVEDTPLGTAGAVKLADNAARRRTFIIISGDALTDIDLTALHRTTTSAKATT